MDLLIRKHGTLIDVSPDGQSPLPREVVDLISPELVYQHKRLLRGPEAWDETGQREGVIVEPRAMYTIDGGRLTTGYGFIPRIARILQRAGHVPRFMDVSPPRRRPECYTPCPEALSQITFRPRQYDCLRAIAEAPGGVINAPVAFGKTFLFLALAILFPRAKIAIVVASKDVAARIVRQLSGSLPNVGLVGGGKYFVGRVTVYTAGSMGHCDGDVDFLFADEAHQLVSPKHSENLARVFRYTRNYAFTATPDCRLDGAHAKLECFFGPAIFNMTYPEAVDLGLVVPLGVRWVPIPQEIGNPASGKSGVPRQRWGIWRNQERNRIIAEDIHAHYTQNEQVLVSVATVDHAIYLWQFLPEFELCYGEQDGGELEQYKHSRLLPHNFMSMTAERRNQLRTAFESGALRRVIATDVWSTGVDFNQLQVLWRADARESEILAMQWPGRACRIYEGKASAEVVDCVDRFDPTFKRKSETRRRHYKKFGCVQDWPRGASQISQGF